MLVKPGYKTSELWLAVLVSAGQLIAALASQLRPEWAAFGTAAASLGYSLSRGQAKRPPVIAGAPAAPVVTTPPTA